MMHLRWAWFGFFIFAFICLIWMFRYDWVAHPGSGIVALDRWTGEIVLLYGERYSLSDVRKGLKR